MGTGKVRTRKSCRERLFKSNTTLFLLIRSWAIERPVAYTGFQENLVRWQSLSTPLGLNSQKHHIFNTHSPLSANLRQPLSVIVIVLRNVQPTPRDYVSSKRRWCRKISHHHDFTIPLQQLPEPAVLASSWNMRQKAMTARIFGNADFYKVK